MKYIKIAATKYYSNIEDESHTKNINLILNLNYPLEIVNGNSDEIIISFHNNGLINTAYLKRKVFLDETNKEEIIKEYLFPSIMIPIFVYLFSFISSSFVILLPEMLLVIIVAGFLTGFGYSLIYKQGLSASVVYLVEEMIGKLTKFHSKIYSWIFDVIILIVSIFLFGYQVTLYSMIIIFISKYMITKTRFGINDSKMFYIITNKASDVKQYIIHDLKYELTVLDVKGGFSKKKNQIFLTIIDTKDYYKLKEGIRIIDPNAFIAISDTYDVVNRKTF